MARAAGYAHDDTPQAKLDKLDAVLAQSFMPRLDAALFAEMLSLPNDGRYSKLELNPQQRRQRTLQALTAQLEKLASQQPTLMIFEDVHWIDPTSLEALNRTIDRIKTLPVLLIVTFRPEFNAPWTGQSHVTSLVLNRLGKHEAAAIIVGVAGNKELLPAHLIAQRYSRLVIDCNRPPGAASSIPILSEATTIPGNEGISREAAETRRREVFDPYHRRIDEAIGQRLRDKRPTILVSLHSFTPVYAGIARPWHIAALYQRDTTLPPLLLHALRAEGDLVVGDNEPYAVNDATDYTIPVHGEARGLINTGIEIRQDLIADEDGQQQWAERLARILGAIGETLGPAV